MLVLVFAFGDVTEAENVPCLFFLVELLLVLQAALLLIQYFLVVVDKFNHFSYFFSNAQNVIISARDGLGDVLPLLEQLVTFIMLLLELFCCLVQFNL